MSSGTSQTPAELLALAEAIAREVHAGQSRPGGKPYILHVEEVVRLVGDASPYLVAAAWLHDVVEDGYLTTLDLAARGIPLRVSFFVLQLTRSEHETYAEYIARLPWGARIVKTADLIANLGDAATLTPSLRKRYEAALMYFAKNPCPPYGA